VHVSRDILTIKQLQIRVSCQLLCPVTLSG